LRAEVRKKSHRGFFLSREGEEEKKSHSITQKKEKGNRRNLCQGKGVVASFGEKGKKAWHSWGLQGEKKEKNDRF